MKNNKAEKRTVSKRQVVGTSSAVMVREGYSEKRILRQKPE
jgi:hypothetical protein